MLNDTDVSDTEEAAYADADDVYDAAASAVNADAYDVVDVNANAYDADNNDDATTADARPVNAANDADTDVADIDANYTAVAADAK